MTDIPVGRALCNDLVRQIAAPVCACGEGHQAYRKPAPSFARLPFGYAAAIPHGAGRIAGCRPGQRHRLDSSRQNSKERGRSFPRPGETRQSRVKG